MNTNQVLADVFIEVMQGTGFVDVALAEKTYVKGERSYVVKLDILMPYLGDLVVEFSEDVASQMVCNISGKDYNSEEGHVIYTDIVNEFLNVFAGKLFEVLAPQLLFEIGLPAQVAKSSLGLDKYEVLHFMTPEGFGVDLYKKFKSFNKH